MKKTIHSLRYKLRIVQIDGAAEVHLARRLETALIADHGEFAAFGYSEQ